MREEKIDTLNVQRIEFKVVDLPKQKIDLDSGCYVDFYPTHIVYRLNFYADEPINLDDERLGTQRTRNDFTVVVLKKYLTSVEMVYQPETSLWKILVSVLGSQRDLQIYYKNKKEAAVTLQQFINYVTYVEPV